MKYRYLCFNCGEEELDEFLTKFGVRKNKICSNCGFTMKIRKKGKTLRTIKFSLIVIAIALLTFIIYYINFIEQLK